MFIVRETSYTFGLNIVLDRLEDDRFSKLIKGNLNLNFVILNLTIFVNKSAVTCSAAKTFTWKPYCKVYFADFKWTSAPFILPL